MFRHSTNLLRLSRTYCIHRISSTVPPLPACFPSFNDFRKYSVSAKPQNVATSIPDKAIESTRDTTFNTSQGNDTFSTEAGDEDQERKLKILKLEVSVLRQEGRKVPDPDRMKPAQWESLMQLGSKSARAKYYSFLWGKECKKEGTKARKELQREEGLIRRADKLEEMRNNEHIIYSLAHTSFLLRIYETTMNHWHNNKLTRAMQFGQKLVLDCSYDQHMTSREAINAAKQLMFCFAENRYHDQPFDLYFCNVNPKSTTMRHLHSHIPTLMEPHFPLNVHEASYLDLFPKDQLVYLTPHCKNDLTEYNHDHIYIVGAMVDTVNNEPLSLAKAKREGIKMARLPLDRYLQWGSGSGKSLTLNQMTNILLDLNSTGDWNRALEHVPRRKIIKDGESQQHQRERWVRSMDKFRITDNRNGESAINSKPIFRPSVTANAFNKANFKPKKPS